MRSLWSALFFIGAVFSINNEVIAATAFVTATTCEVPQQSSQTTCDITVTWHGHSSDGGPDVIPGGDFEERSTNTLTLSGSVEPCLYKNNVSKGCGENGSITLSVETGLHFFEVRTPLGEMQAGAGVNISYDEYVAPFNWTTSTHKEIVGDFDGNNSNDIFVQPILKTSQSGLFPQQLNSQYISNFHRNWSPTHPQIPAIEDWSQESYGAYTGNFNSNPGDELLLLGNKNIILLHGDIITPIVTFPKINNAIVSWDSSKNASYSAFEFDANPADYEVIIGDLTGDGFDEIFLQGKTKGSTSYILNSSGGLVQTLNNGYLNIDWSAESFDLVISGGQINLYARDLANDDNVAYLNGGVVTSLENEIVVITTEPHVEPFPTEDMSSTSVGSINGEYKTNASGGATYIIPVEVPSGIAGLTPNISVEYSSQNNNSMLGVGWNINGFSSIARCRKTRALDGYIKGIQLNQEDALCLDGQRLVITSTDSSFWGNGTEFHTKIESNQKITSISSGYGNFYFTVHKPDGKIYTYGSEPNASHKIGTVTYRWFLSKIEDRYGNTINFSYEGANNQEKRISKVEYADYSITFVYESRNDISQRYLLGQSFRNTQRLSDIRVHHNAVEINHYNINYIYSDFSNRSLVNSIERCTSESGICLPVTSFEYSEPELSYQETVNQALNLGANTKIFSAYPLDIDGDGSSEIAVAYCDTSDGKGYLKFIDYSNSSINISPTSIIAGVSYGYSNYTGHCQDRYRINVQIGDFDNNSVDDIFAGGHIYYYQKDGSRTVKPQSLSSHWEKFVQDIDGDGWLDLIEDNGFSLNQRDSSTRFAQKYELFPNSYEKRELKQAIEEYEKLPDTSNYRFLNHYDFYSFLDAKSGFRRPIDINGDGQLDFARTYYHETCLLDDPHNASCDEGFTGVGVFKGWIVDGVDFGIGFDGSPVQYLSESHFRPYQLQREKNGEWGFSVTNQEIDPSIDLLLSQTDERHETPNIYMGDLNGDGLTDLFTDGRTHVSTGTRFITKSSNGISNIFEKEAVRYLDLNGDGNADRVGAWLNNTSGNAKGFYVQLSDGEQFGDRKFLFSSSWDHMRKRIPIWVDLGGNGILDSVLIDIDTKTIIIHEDDNPQYKAEDLLVRVINGVNNQVDIEYKPLTDSNVYSPLDGVDLDSGGIYGTAITNIVSPIPVVSSVYKDSSLSVYGVKSRQHFTYSYEGLRHQAGRGSLGFKRMRVKDELKGFTTEREYRQDYPFTGRLIKEERKYNGELVYSREVTDFTYLYLNEAKTVFIADKTVRESKYQFDVFQGNVLQQSQKVFDITTTSTYKSFSNSYANLAKKVVVSSDSISHTMQTREISFKYDDEDVTSWLIGKVTNQLQKFNREENLFSLPEIVQEIEYTYGDNGEVESKVIEPNGDQSSYLKQHYSYDAYGANTQKTDCSLHFKDLCSAINIPDTNDDNTKIFRRIRFTPNDSRTVIVKVENLMFTEFEMTSYDSWGRPLSRKDENGVVHEYRYDGFGQEYFSRTSTGSFIKSTKQLCSSIADCPQNAYMRLVTETNDNSISYKYFDHIGQEVRESVKLLTGKLSHTDTVYDVFGRVLTVSEPYIKNNDVKETSYTYDDFDRPINIVMPDGLITVLEVDFGEYAKTVSGSFSGSIGSWSTYINQVVVEKKNASGELISITDNNSNKVSYSYDAIGNPLTLKGVDSHLIVNTYDNLGRRLSINDPDKGLWQTQYNALGETIQITAPGSIITTNHYDNVGRNIKRNISNQGNDEVSHFSFSGVHLDAEWVVGGPRYDYTYDDFGRVSSSKLNIDNYIFSSENLYDSYGRLFKAFDASGNNRGLRYQYKNGYLYKTFEAKNGSLYFRADDMDARGNVVEFIQGNGIKTIKKYNNTNGALSRILTGSSGMVQNLYYEFDGLGNLRARQDSNQVSPYNDSIPMYEVFSYDELNRLETSSISGTQLLSVTYSGNGNIATKTGMAGSYAYGNNQAVCNSSIVPGPHAVTSIGSNYYCYDERGNQLSSYNDSTLQRSVTYSAFDKPTYIQSPKGTTSFLYDNNHHRVKRTDVKDGETVVTYYVGSVEVESKSAGGFGYKRFIDDVAIQTIQSNGSSELVYVHQDHLGSADVITYSNGTVKQRLSFSAFGERRNPEVWSDVILESELLNILDITKKGFTGHEQVDHAGIIHMNGRIYDPVSGRFMQADPIIQEVKNSQNLNRYSYVLNNPLSYTDPTGYMYNGHIDIVEKLSKDNQIDILKNEIDEVQNLGEQSQQVGSLNRKALEGKQHSTSQVNSVITADAPAASSTPSISVGNFVKAVSRSLLKGGPIASAIIGALTPSKVADATITDAEREAAITNYIVQNTSEKELSAKLTEARVASKSNEKNFYSVYHRRESPTQTVADSILQTVSQSIWGSSGRMNFEPVVRAFVGPLPAGVPGVEFVTKVTPTSVSPAPGGQWALWYQSSPGVQSRKSGDYAAIPVFLYKNTQVFRE